MKACRIGWCDKPIRALGYCNPHYQRLRRGADMDEPHRAIPDYGSTCLARACERAAGTRGYCGGHYARYREGRDVDGPLRIVDPDRGCAVPGCDRRHAARGYCNLHFDRARGRINLAIDAPIRQSIADACDFAAAHVRVRVQWGPAKQYPCIACSKPARDWAYDGTDPTELLGQGHAGGSLMRYSLFPEFYMPMCSKCHHSRDKGIAAAELREYREFKHRTGLTLPEVEQLLNQNI